MHSLAGGALGVFDLPVAAALLAEIATVEELGLDLFQGQSTAGGVFRPRHIGAMEIAAVDWIGVKFPEGLHPNALSTSVPPARLCHLDSFALFIFLDVGKEFRRLGINAPRS